MLNSLSSGSKSKGGEGDEQLDVDPAGDEDLGPVLQVEP